MDKIFIDGLVKRVVISRFPDRVVISRFPDRTFCPNTNLTRAQFATIVSKAFPIPDKRSYILFIDVPATQWVAAIQTAFKRGFISGYSDHLFKPENMITRAEALVALVSGIFGANPARTTNLILSNIYQDSREIPNYAKKAIVLAT